MAHVLTRRRGPAWCDEAGIGMLTALMVVFVVFVVAGVWVQTSVHQTSASGAERDREMAFAAAEAGINQAMSRLAVNAMDCSDIGPVDIGGAQYEVEFFPGSCDAVDSTRYFVARGYAPSKAHPRPQRRQLEQQVDLVPLSGFRYALFAEPGGITGANYSDIIGDVYSSGPLDLANHSQIKGDVTGLLNVMISNGTVVTGTVHAGGSVTMDHEAATVEGNVLAGTTVTTRGIVKGNAQAGGAIAVTHSGRVEGEVAPYSPPPPPAEQTLPTFDPDALSYTNTYTAGSTFKSHWSTNRNSFSGTYRLNVPADSERVILDQEWQMSGDTVIVSNGPLGMSRQVTKASGDEHTLALVSFAEGDAVTLTNDQSIPRDIAVLIYAPNGCVSVSQMKDFSGVVYAKCISLSNNFNLTYKPVELLGFSWSLASSTQFVIESRVFREVPFTSPL